MAHDPGPVLIPIANGGAPTRMPAMTPVGPKTPSG